MEKDFNTGLRRSLEADRIKLTRRRKQLLREMGYSEDPDTDREKTIQVLGAVKDRLTSLLNYL